jgi:hypothetical protein
MRQKCLESKGTGTYLPLLLSTPTEQLEKSVEIEAMHNPRHWFFTSKIQLKKLLHM